MRQQDPAKEAILNSVFMAENMAFPAAPYGKTTCTSGARPEGCWASVGPADWPF